MKLPAFVILSGLFLPFCAWAQHESVTLDPEAMAEVWREMSGVPGVRVSSGETSGASAAHSPSALWREARRAAQDSTFPVLVLHMLQSLNPQLPMGDNVWAYAAALELHRQAFSGNPRAVAEMSAALRCGRLGGINYFVDIELAAELEGTATLPLSQER